ncbi:hypothetical protein ACK4CS_12705 [Enterococcus gallinarum]|uniref:Uncharacterized protein n=1 Tax=Enterococcus gallinarum TaxID=1353 RepID=A0AAE4HSV9_ENTGA|nr:hypothetical protein [Enterococcus gallinarum]MDT2691516.1 hypothetical protein [Enterococcus gallinarum]
MKKKLVPIIISLILITAGTVGYLSLKPKTESTNAETATTLSTKTIVSSLPSLKDLKANLGENLTDLGKVQISTVLFQDVNQAILTRANNEEIKVPLSVTDKDTPKFSLVTIEYTPEELRIGDTFGLAVHNSHYYAYNYR